MSMTRPKTQHQRMMDILHETSVVRAIDLRNSGISATTISRGVASGDVHKIKRGLYQLADAEIPAEQNLIEAVKQVPRGKICLISALAFHGLTDQIPRKIWMAIGAKDRMPSCSYPPLRIVRFRAPYLSSDVELHTIGGVDIPVYSIARALADAFRIPNLVDRSVAIEAMRNALTMNKVTASQLAQSARDNRAWQQMRPYLEALTSNG